MKKLYAPLWITGSVVFSIAGFVAFFLLFFPDFNVYILIISPVVLVMYQAPAVLLFYFYKKRKKKIEGEEEEEEKEEPSSKGNKDGTQLD
jgi:Na+/H+ antiporter NhaD/arsenite permease-like protein